MVERCLITECIVYSIHLKKTHAMIGQTEPSKHRCDWQDLTERFTCVWRTNMPWLSAQEKYFFPWTVPLFFPIGSSNTTPIHFPDMKARYILFLSNRHDILQRYSRQKLKSGLMKSVNSIHQRANKKQDNTEVYTNLQKIGLNQCRQPFQPPLFRQLPPEYQL